MLLWLALALAAPDSAEDYVQLALDSHPALAAEAARSEAAREQVARARSLPDPTVSAGVFAQSVETRVGPQQVRVGVQQALPWPSKLVQGGKAANAAVDVAERRVEVVTLGLEQTVRQAYVELWAIRARHHQHHDHVAILEGLAEAARARMEIGSASLADVQQVELTRTRMADELASLDSQEGAAEARLRALVGVDGELATEEPPEVSEPGEASIDGHPELAALDASVTRAEHQRKATSGARLPDLTVGADWIVTGPETTHDPVDSGKDAVIVGVGMKLPVWQGTYGHDVSAARSLEEAARQSRSARALELKAELASVSAELSDSARKVDLVRDTLLPQAQAAYEAVLGEYVVGRVPVSQVLSAQQALLELALEGVDALERHGMAKARYQALTGSP